MKTITKLLVALGAGLAIGGVLGVLFAPRNGKETREKLKEQSEKLKAGLNEKFRWGKEKMSEQLSRADRQADEFI
jgi:gas vesicle protein